MSETEYPENMEWYLRGYMIFGMMANAPSNRDPLIAIAQTKKLAGAIISGHNSQMRGFPLIGNTYKDATRSVPTTAQVDRIIKDTNDSIFIRVNEALKTQLGRARVPTYR